MVLLPVQRVAALLVPRLYLLSCSCFRSFLTFHIEFNIRHDALVECGLPSGTSSFAMLSMFATTLGMIVRLWWSCGACKKACNREARHELGCCCC